ncbi:hypothetical protein Anas_07947 [Armadillidium nasatum]|uniref:Uncharacterized protein n=1 Tax=Armadillidium nasatum TaxID=96803 RepID=A0A5N5SXW0_9CRUS|nr:hypothetical protein Anas_07947 [Armadillidium nasatum]
MTEANMKQVVHHAAITLLTFNVLKELVTVSEDTPRDEFVTKESMNFPLSHMYLKYLGDDALDNLRREIKEVLIEIHNEELKN